MTATVTTTDEPAPPAAATKRRHLPFDAAAVVVLAVLGGVLPVLAARHFGVFGIPRNGDDWSYLLTLFRFAHHGGFNGNGWASMNLVGQVVLATPAVLVLGDRIGGAQVVIASLGVVGLAAVYDLAKSFTTPARSLFVASIVALGPMWATYAVSFMTDVPFLALMAVCLAFGGRGVRASGVRLPVVAVSLLVGLVAFSIREYAVVAPVAVLAVAAWQDTAGRRRRLVAWVLAALAFAAVALAFEAWRHTLPGWSDLQPARPTAAAVKPALHLLLQLAMSAGLAIAPVVVLGGPVARLRRAWSTNRLAVAAVVVGLVAAFGSEIARHRHDGLFFWIPFLMPLRLAGQASRPVVPVDVMLLLAVVGAAAVTLLVIDAVPSIWAVAGRITRRDVAAPRHPATAMVGLTLAALCGLYVVALLTGLPVWDRYVLPLVPLLALLAVRGDMPVGRAPARSRSGAWARPGAVAATTAVVVGFALVHGWATASRDGAGWRAAVRATAVTGDPLQVQFTPEWTDWHDQRLDPVLPGCAVVAGTERSALAPDDAAVVARQPVWTPWGPAVDMVARRTGPCGPPGSATAVRGP